MLKVFKIKVAYTDDAHPEQIIAVPRGGPIKTARDAESHCLRHLHHKDQDTFEIFPARSAVALRDEPFDESDAPKVISVQQFIEKAAAAGGQAIVDAPPTKI